MTEQKNTHTHADGTTHDHPHDDPQHEHTRPDGTSSGAEVEGSDTHEHTHADGTTHTHEHGAEEKQS